MQIFEVDVKKTIQLAVVPLIDGRSILYSRWKGENKKFFSCIVKNEDINYLSLLSTPEEISDMEDKIEVGKIYNGDPSYGHLYLVYFCSYDHTVYGSDGNLLNNTYSDSFTEDTVVISSILRDEEILKPFMEIVPDRYGEKVYYVRGNGDTISYKFKMTPEEYRRFIMESPFDRFRKFMLHKLGVAAKMYFVNDD